jgi:hypothetical protein
VICISDPHAEILFGSLRAVMNNDGEGLRRWARDSHVIKPGHTLEPSELLTFWRKMIAHLVTVEPHTIDHDYVTKILAARSARRGADGDFARFLNVPPDLTFALRLDVSLLGVLAGLRATCPWGEITNELDHAHPPATTLGEVDAEFWRMRDPDGDRVSS